MSWFFPIALTLVLYWLGVPLVPVAVALFVFVWWFMADRPARYGRPPSPREPVAPSPSERPPER